MGATKLKTKTKEWLRRYIPAEILGTLLSLISAWLAYNHTHSFATAAAAGWTGEGIGFYGYFIAAELLLNARRYQAYAFGKRIALAATKASTNLLVEFAPAEIFDGFLIRPFMMYVLPQLIHPYAIGFLAGKFSADAVFYFLAIFGYEVRKRWMG